MEEEQKNQIAYIKLENGLPKEETWNYLFSGNALFLATFIVLVCTGYGAMLINIMVKGINENDRLFIIINFI